MKILTNLFLAVIILAGCTSTNPDDNLTVVNSNTESVAAITALNGDQIRTLIIGKTLVGRSNNFPQVGPIDFWIFYAADGTAKDRLKFVRGGKIDRASGVWRIVDEEQGLFCSTFAKKRRNGVEVCSRIFVTNDQFRTEPVNSNKKGVIGRIVSGDQVQ